MKNPNRPSKWNSNDKPRTVLASVPAPDVVDKTGAKVTNLPSRSAEASPSPSEPADDKRDSKR
ncbi:hypothetical protein [Tahibacter caeni]|uniref:hypothetical protein n=1 Tax=Tahibacter caeni TaxID=1453545 RepID=UPI0021475F91|nr:hypothetical protein [Tahibacter caeni]